MNPGAIIAIGAWVAAIGFILGALWSELCTAYYERKYRP